MRQQGHEHRQVPLERRGAEVLVHLVEAVEHRAEVLRADGEHGREANRRVHRIAPAHPVPEAEHVGGVDAELGHLLRIGRDGDEMLRHGALVPAQSLEQPIARALGIGHGLQRREGLGRHDEQRLRRVEVAGRLHEINPVNVGDEPEGHCPLAVMLERFVGHDRPEVRAADADVDHVADALAGVALPRAAADAVGEVGHLVEHGMHLGDDVLAVHDDGSVFRRAQGDVQHGAVFREVDLVPAEHRVHALAQAGFGRQLHEQLEGLVGDAVLGVIQEEARGLRRHPLAAFRVSREQLPQMPAPGRSGSGR